MKHIFLHGWGREVRFLPALDGKGVVPIPQSSSDLSKEEMTDFIEYILKEGAERGVQFDDHSSSAAPQAEDEGSGEDSPSPPAADQSAPAEPEAERPEAGHDAAADSASGDVDERAMVSSARPMNTDFLKAEMVRKLLQMAGDQSLSAQERLENLDNIRPAWDDQIKGHPGMVKQCFDTAAKVVRGELPSVKARQYMEGL